MSTLLADLPATPRQIARHLDLSESTLKRYEREDQAPRAVMLALFWESRWGRSAADCEAHNWGAVYHRKAMGLERENALLRRQLAALESMLQDQQGAANSPFFKHGS